MSRPMSAYITMNGQTMGEVTTWEQPCPSLVSKRSELSNVTRAMTRLIRLWTSSPFSFETPT
ncbi:hypothetical protein DPMN_018060 [Dreissena polymorpha]|uniref:Uncharacterized protein n=1 Tax=Dreissena polymorpha TaxID=45954 RepID=A0A9D4S815_DREPO|nr:hypothetical protein DPMN_018060 [Dreissena polymorpha]